MLVFCKYVRARADVVDVRVAEPLRVLGGAFVVDEGHLGYQNFRATQLGVAFDGGECGISYANEEKSEICQSHMVCCKKKSLTQNEPVNATSSERKKSSTSTPLFLSLPISAPGIARNSSRSLFFRLYSKYP